MSPSALLEMPGVQCQEEGGEKADFFVKQPPADEINRQNREYTQNGCWQARGVYAHTAEGLKR